MIRIKVTDEMIRNAWSALRAMREPNDMVSPLRAVLDIVERDINEAAGEDDSTGHMILIENGCIEVTI